MMNEGAQQTNEEERVKKKRATIDITLDKSGLHVEHTIDQVRRFEGETDAEYDERMAVASDVRRLSVLLGTPQGKAALRVLLFLVAFMLLAACLTAVWIARAG